MIGKALCESNATNFACHCNMLAEDVSLVKRFCGTYQMLYVAVRRPISGRVGDPQMCSQMCQSQHKTLLINTVADTLGHMGLHGYIHLS